MNSRKNSTSTRTRSNKQTSNIKNYSKYKEKSKIVKIKQNRLLLLLLLCVLIFVLLIFRLIYWQIFQHSRLKEELYSQLTTTITISPKRGTIYDTNNKAIAISAEVDTVSINPNLIVCSDEDDPEYEYKTKILKERVSRALSDIFELDYNEVAEKVASTKSVETIIRKVEQDKITQLKNWMKENKVYSGINIDTDTKRYYPYDNLASNLIGFCGSDNQGLAGLESRWNSTLTGTPGKLTTATDAVEDAIPDKNEQYVDVENGSDLTLSIDINVQSIAEKYLKQAVTEGSCAGGGNVIIMKPTTGDILAMATYPNYNLNDPFTPNETAGVNWDKQTLTEKNNNLQLMWRNTAVSNTYEPGSTFKIITASIGLEENLTDTDISNDFNCSGHEDIYGTKISCWKTSSHGSLTLRGALMQSCNPALMQLGKRIGAETLYKYYKAFGLFDKTGIATSGEANSYFYDLEDVGPVELATMSFGQRFTITPIQLITAVSGIVNDGVMMKPRLVKQISNPDTNSVTTIEPTKVRQIVSKETSSKICNMLESVVTDGTAQYGQVKGYSIGGKTGTSEPPPGKEDEVGFVASYIAITPAENPEIVILVTLYNPKAANHSGGGLAGPVVSQILSEVLPYLGVSSSITTTETNTETEPTITLPDVRNKTFAEAKSILEDLGFSINIKQTSNDTIIVNQVPKPGSGLIQNSKITLYAENDTTAVSTTVPNLKGKSLAEAKNALKAKNLNIHYTGSGTVISQDPTVDTLVEEGTIVNVILKSEIRDTH